MTVSTVMQLQKHQPGSRRFTILVGDSQGQQHIAVMAGQMLAGEVGLQLRITYGGKQLGHRAPKPPVRQEKIRHLKNKVRDAFLSQIVGAERLGNLPSDAPHLHFQLLLLHIPACNAEGAQSPKRSSLRRIIPVSATPKMPVEPVISLKILLLSRSFRV